MNKAILAVGIILLASAALLIINMVNGASTGSELDYYLLKETTEAAMIDSVDVAYYASSGLIRMDKEKFVESFARRFAASVDKKREYRVRFYDINETPPKVSVLVDSSTSSSFDGDNIDITTNVDAILESVNKKDELTKKLLQDPNNDLGKSVQERNIDK